MSANLSRAYASEMNAFAQKNVIITTKSGKTVHGLLIGLNTEDMNMILADAILEGKKSHRLFLAGSTVAEMVLGEAPFDMSVLKMELERVFKKSGVRYFDDTRTIVVLDRFKVTEEEVSGEGPVADRIRMIWQSVKDDFNVAKAAEES